MLEILGKIGFDWQVALANLVNFLIIFFILRRFAWKPLKNVIEERQQKIVKGLEDAQKAATDLMMAEEIRKQKVEDAKLHANQIVSDANLKSASIISAAEGDAMIAREKIIKDAHKVADEAQASMRREVEEHTAGLVMQGLEKVLKESMTADTQKQYIQRLKM